MREVRANTEMTRMIDCVADASKHDPMTSVITWTRYDGTPETLPEEDRTVILKTQKLVTVGDRSMGSWFVVGNTFTDNAVELTCREGDIWAYLPTPPAE